MLGKTEEAVLSAYNYHAKLDALIKLEKAKCEAFYSANPLKKFYLTTRCLVAVPPELDFSHTEKIPGHPGPQIPGQPQPRYPGNRR